MNTPTPVPESGFDFERIQAAVLTIEAALTSVNESIPKTCNKLDQLHVELSQRRL